nr:threonine synthase [Candidatus Njordarchaeota archaeon]
MELCCQGCSSSFEATVPPIQTCSKCGDLLTVTYDYKAIQEKISCQSIGARAPGTWKYWELLPLRDAESVISLGEGETYLHRCVRLAEILELKNLYIKNETLNPTGSFNDRGATVVVSMANQAKLVSLHCASVGNLAVSLSAYSAKAGMKFKVFMPREVDLGKLYQLIAYGAQITLMDSIDEATLESTRFRGSYGVGLSDPYLVEGEKTIGFEVCEQLGWHAPDFLLVPLGSGGNLHAIWKSLKELSAVGIVPSPSTSMIGIQSALCAPIVEAFSQGKSVSVGKTIAAEIAIANPQFKRNVLRALHESNGLATAVSDDKILESIHLLAKYEGIFAEPSAASTIAGLRELIDSGKIDRSDEVVCVITGAGLKDPSTAMKLVSEKQGIRGLVPSTGRRKFVTKLGPTKMQILEILSLRSLYGYGIWKDLKSRHNVEIKIPVVYQHLQELEEVSLIRKTRSRGTVGGREKFYYSLTDQGKKFLRLWEKSTF